MKKMIIPLLFFYLFLQGCRYDESGFTIDSNIREYVAPVVLSPAEGDTVYTGGQMNIRWENFKCRTVRIELWKKKQYYFREIADKTENKGEFIWTVPLETASSVSYQVKIINYTSPDDYVYSSYFIIRPH